MAKVIRLKSDEARRWFQNISVVKTREETRVEGQGEYRPVTRSETTIIRDLTKLVGAKKPKLEKVSKDGTVVEVSLEKRDRGDPFQIVRIDGAEVVEGRQALREELFQKHGDCQVHTMAGKFLTAIRDHSKARPKASHAQKVGPKAQSCQCREWKKPKRDKEGNDVDPAGHHPICQWYRKGPREDADQGSDSETQAPSPKSSVPSPDECACKPWKRRPEMPKDGHHPTCQHREAWEALQTGVDTYHVVDLGSGSYVRVATAEEIKIAKENESRTGILSLAIGDEHFGLVPAGDVEETREDEEEVGELDEEEEKDLEVTRKQLEALPADKLKEGLDAMGFSTIDEAMESIREARIKNAGKPPSWADSPEDSLFVRTKTGKLKPGQTRTLVYNHQRPFKLRGFSGKFGEKIFVSSVQVGEDEQLATEGRSVPLFSLASVDAKAVDIGTPLLVTLQNVGEVEEDYEVVIETREIL